MRAFTDEEFELMLYELIELKPAKYDMMCLIVRKVLEPKVKGWCYKYSSLRGRQYEDDVMQEICIRLIKTCVTSFFIREDKPDFINRDPIEFCAWITAVGRNYTHDFALKQYRYDIHTQELTDTVFESPLFDDIAEERQEKLSQAFNIALSAKKKPHIKLTWLIQSSLMIYYCLSKIDATEVIDETLSDESLNRIWEMVQVLTKRISWIHLSYDDTENFSNELDKHLSDENTIGNTRYNYYFGNRGGKGAISDWAYRMNSYIKSRINYEPFND